MTDSLDTDEHMRHNGGVDSCLMIQSELYPLVFFRNAKARFWADTSVRHGETATQAVAQIAAAENVNYLIVHPEDDPDDIPFDYEGKLIRFNVSDSDGKRLNMAN